MIPDFRLWAARMGYGQRAISKAGEAIGLTGKSTTSLTYNGRRELTETERLAMTAVRLGLKPWTPEYDDELQATGLASKLSSAA